MNYLAIDVGGTAIKYGLMSKEAEILDRGTVETPQEGTEAYVNLLEEIYREYQGQVSGIAMCVPGIIDSRHGFCVTGGNLKYIHNFPLEKMLKERVKVPVTVENDAKCAALAEVWRGSLKGCRDGIVLVLGSGVGGAIIKDGRIHKGKHFSAGEFSFIELGGDISSPDNICGNRNGIWALMQEVSDRTGIPEEELSGVRIFEMAEAGDRRVLEAIDGYTFRLARLILNLQAIYDPELFAVGGGISQQELLFTCLEKNIQLVYDSYPLDIPRAKVVKCRFLNDSNLIGALYYHLKRRGGLGVLGMEA